MCAYNVRVSLLAFSVISKNINRLILNMERTCPMTDTFQDISIYGKLREG